MTVTFWWPPWGFISLIFASQNIFHVERPQLSKQKIGTITHLVIQNNWQEKSDVVFTPFEFFGTSIIPYGYFLHLGFASSP